MTFLYQWRFKIMERASYFGRMDKATRRVIAVAMARSFNADPIVQNGCAAHNLKAELVLYPRVGLAVLLSLLISACSDQAPTMATPSHLTAAKAKAMQLCAGCHGPQGIGTAPFNPNLACQKKVYMVKQLNDYRNGSRTSHLPMANIAKMLSENEVDSISEWYSITGCP